MQPKGNNIFTNLLALLRVKHTERFSDRYFNEHPHKYNLLGLSKMLSDYGVENAATRIADKDADLQRIETPFVAQFGGEFVIVREVSDEKVTIVRFGKEMPVNPKDFIQAWTGIVLLAEPSEKSGEPDYKEHRLTEFLASIQKYGLYAAAGLLFALVFRGNALFKNLDISLLLVLNIAGLFVSYLLVRKQLHFSSRLSDKICSLFSRHDCNNVLESSAAKLFGVFGWSEIGAGYFLANILLLLFRPDFVPYLAIINILALPYTIWSVWYQKFRAKQWCGLCLIVQMLLWVIFAVDIVFGFIKISQSTPPLGGWGVIIEDWGVVLSIFSIIILSINILAPKLAEGRQISYLKQELNSLKADEDIFLSFLKKQPRHEVSRDDSVILFGNPDAKLFITILSNPYCNPCAAMHRRVEKFLKDVGGQVCIQYILSSFGEELEGVNKHLLAVSLEKDEEKTMTVFSGWFKKGKPEGEKFFEPLGACIANPAVEAEFAKHRAWRERTGIRATPTLLVNGWQLPENYRLEHLRYFTDLDVICN